MIDLTPLDVRKKRGDFRKGMRGYDAGEVDTFLELVAERFEALVKENLTLKERSARLADQVKEQQGREKAVQDALVTAQALREDIGNQAHREAELLRREAEAEIERMILEAENRVDELKLMLDQLERRRRRFLRAFRTVLERELDVVHVEESRDPLEQKPLELELFGSIAGPDPRDRPGSASALPAGPSGGPTVDLPEEGSAFETAGAGVAASVPGEEDAASQPDEWRNEPQDDHGRGQDTPPDSARPLAAPTGEPNAGERGGAGQSGSQDEPQDEEWTPHWRFSLGHGDSGPHQPPPSRPEGE